MALSFFSFCRTYNPNLAYLESSTSSLFFLPSSLCPIRSSLFQLASTFLLSHTHTYTRSPFLFSLPNWISVGTSQLCRMFLFHSLSFFSLLGSDCQKHNCRSRFFAASYPFVHSLLFLPLDPVARRTDDRLNLSGCRPPSKKRI